MKKTFRLFCAMAMLWLVGLPADAAMYIVGNDPFGGWQTNAGVEMTGNGTTYTATVDVNSTVYFVFATQLCSGANDWSTFANYRLGPKSNGTEVKAGNTYTATADRVITRSCSMVAVTTHSRLIPVITVSASSPTERLVARPPERCMCWVRLKATVGIQALALR